MFNRPYTMTVFSFGANYELQIMTLLRSQTQAELEMPVLLVCSHVKSHL